MLAAEGMEDGAAASPRTLCMCVSLAAYASALQRLHYGACVWRAHAGTTITTLRFRDTHAHAHPHKDTHYVRDLSVMRARVELTCNLLRLVWFTG